MLLMVVGYFMLLLSGPQPRVGRLDICQSFRATWCAPSAFEANLAFLGNFGLRFSLTRNGTAQQARNLLGFSASAVLPPVGIFLSLAPKCAQ
jgi:hypothetical protein